MKKMLLIAGIFLSVLGIVCGWAQTTFYGYVDESGVVRDSLFLPLSFIFVGLGLSLMVVLLLWKRPAKSKI